jgi:hypothetical protein
MELTLILVHQWESMEITNSTIQVQMETYTHQYKEAYSNNVSLY